MFFLVASVLFYGYIRVGGSTFGTPSALCSDFSKHDSQLAKIVSDIRTRSPELKITLKRRPEQSHCPRPHNYKSSSIQLDISEFDKLLDVEYFSEKRNLVNEIPYQLRSRVNGKEIVAVADVQALMSMEQLVTKRISTSIEMSRKCLRI